MVTITDLPPELLLEEVLFADSITIKDLLSFSAVNKTIRSLCSNLGYWQRRLATIDYRDRQRAILDWSRRGVFRPFFYDLLPTVYSLLDRRTVLYVLLNAIEQNEYDGARIINRTALEHYKGWKTDFDATKITFTKMQVFHRLVGEFVDAVKKLQALNVLKTKHRALFLFGLSSEYINGLILNALNDYELAELYRKYDSLQRNDRALLRDTAFHSRFVNLLARNGRLDAIMKKLTPQQIQFHRLQYIKKPRTRDIVLEELNSPLIYWEGLSALHNDMIDLLTPQEAESQIKQIYGSTDDVTRDIRSIISTAECRGITLWAEELRQISGVVE